MKAGNKGFQWSMVAFMVTMVLASGFEVQAATPEATCANDSLFLLSPDSVLLNRQSQGRQGMVVSWGDLDLEEATCFALTGHEDLDYGVSADGGFSDQVDRQLIFTMTESGSIGSTDPATLLMSWITEGSTIYGVLGGTINLANNGGVYQYGEQAGSWNLVNDGLPMTWRQTNTVAMDAGTNGFMVAGFSAGQTLGSKPQGLYVHNQLGWQIVGEDIFTNSVNIVKISVSPNSNDHFAVGTEEDGLFVTTDGGLNFFQWTDNLDPAFSPAPTTVRITALTWSSSRIWAFVPSFGFFYSEDNGASFNRSDLLVDVNLDVPAEGVALPVSMNDITVNPTDEDHVLVSLQFNGVFQTFDGGLNWNDTYGDLLVADPDNAGAWTYSAASALIDPTDSNILIVGMQNKGLYHSTNGGVNWTRVSDSVNPDNLSSLANMSFLASDGPSGQFYCLMDDWSLLESNDSGATWNHFAQQPLLKKGLSLALVGDGSGDFYMGSWGGGIFVPGSNVSLSETYNSSTSDYLRDLDLGLSITIGAGALEPGYQFTLKCQTFQGWAVWRGSGYDPDEMTLMGIFDRVNPESCIEGYCGNVNWQIIPQCYNSKRAACFDFDTPDTVRFFDEEIYNGFSYYYAVSSFDYGNTALSSPQNSTVTAVYSPRWAGDSLSPYDGVGNRSFIQLDDDPTGATSDETIYVYPNPLRMDSGLPGFEGERVVFAKLPVGSHVKIFTTAGDDVVDLGPETMDGGNIYWSTRNREGESVSAGVYLYKVEMPSREDFWGKLIIIR